MTFKDPCWKRGTLILHFFPHIKLVTLYLICIADITSRNSALAFLPILPWSWGTPPSSAEWVLWCTAVRSQKLPRDLPVKVAPRAPSETWWQCALYFRCQWRWIPSRKGYAIALTKSCVIGIGHKQFLCQDHKALRIKAPMLTAPCHSHTSYLILSSTSCSAKCNFQCWNSTYHLTDWRREVTSWPYLNSIASTGTFLQQPQTQTSQCQNRSRITIFLVWYFKTAIFFKPVTRLRLERES